jgi:1,4-dihydroxy-2-naphthoate octaprenyltransferase
LFALLLLSVAPACTTANIMLANNICDLEKDIAVKRHTLPYYLGKKRALWLFVALYYLVYIAAAALVALRILPPLYLLFLLTFPIVQKNIGGFFKKQDKAETFLLAIKNYVIIMGADTLLIFACAWFA